MGTRARKSRRSRRAHERGFTMVEVLVSVVILTLITGGLSAAFVTALDVARPTSQRLRESNDAQVIAAFLIRDAQAAGGTDPFTGTYDDSTLGVSTTDAEGRSEEHTSALQSRV